MADAQTVIRLLGEQLAQALVAKTIAEVEVNELRQASLAEALAGAAKAEPAE
jgi:hypothetical protein